MRPKARLIYASTERDLNLWYAARFWAGDPFLYLELDGRRTIVVGQLEYGRAREESSARVLCLDPLLERIKKEEGRRRPALADVVARLLRPRRIRRVAVPASFPVGLAYALAKRGIRLRPRPEPFFPARVSKSPEEVRRIEAVQRRNEEALEVALGILRRSRIRGRRLVHRGQTVTSEMVRRAVQMHFLSVDCETRRTIVASGDHGCDPHQVGTGPLRPHETIVLDIFPRSSVTHYCADMTRTVVRGRPSADVVRQYDTVRRAQELVESEVRAGAHGKKVHRKVEAFFKSEGYETRRRGKKWEGFYHGTGHGVGLEVHEPPSISKKGTKLPAGSVVTNEPGLYYFGVGGVRLEDMLLVTPTGCRNLTRAPKELRI